VLFWGVFLMVVLCFRVFSCIFDVFWDLLFVCLLAVYGGFGVILVFFSVFLPVFQDLTLIHASWVLGCYFCGTFGGYFEVYWENSGLKNSKKHVKKAFQVKNQKWGTWGVLRIFSEKDVF